MAQTEYLKKLTLDPHLLRAPDPQITKDRQIAVFDLLEKNSFSPNHAQDANLTGPYGCEVSLSDNRLTFKITLIDAPEVDAFTITLSLSPFKTLMRDYGLICDSYYDALKLSSPTQIEAIDMGRRGVHNEGAELILDRLKGKILLDFETARRLFTLIYALNFKGMI